MKADPREMKISNPCAGWHVKPKTCIHIEGRRWFQKTYGNTYHSVRIFKDGQEVAYIPFSYGYGEQFLQTAWEWLGANGYPELLERNQNGSWKNYGTRYLLEVLGGSYSVIDVQRKKDL